MEKKYESLFTPWKINNVEIKNRIVLCPMGGTSLFGWMEPNHFDKVAADFFLERAKNNVGLIIPGIAPLRDTLGGRWLYQNKAMFKKLKVFMDEIHKTGAKLFVQLTAGFGRSFAITDSLTILAKNKVLDLVELLGNRKQLFIRNLWSGIAKGIGIGIGVTVITAVLVIILQKIVTLNIPVIGEYIADIIEIVERSR